MKTKKALLLEVGENIYEELVEILDLESDFEVTIRYNGDGFASDARCRVTETREIDLEGVGDV